MSRRRRFFIGGGVVGAALIYLLGAGIGSNLVYYLTPSELLAKGEDAVQTPLRLSGRVRPGSVDWNADARELRFVVEDDVSAVPVESSGIPPDMFHDGIDVVLEGSLTSAGSFQATSLMVKHSNEYGPDQEGQPASERFRGLTHPEGGS